TDRSLQTDAEPARPERDIASDVSQVRLDSHRARGPGDDLHRLLDVPRVEIRHLRLGDLPHLVARQTADLLAVRLPRALLEPQRLLDQDRGRRRLRDEVEGTVLVDRDLHGRDAAVLLRGLRVERLAELHDVDAVLAERRAD